MYAFTVTVDIDATPARVWRALCDPAEVVQWDTGVSGALDAPPDYPRPGQHVRWRCRRGLFRILHDRPQEVVREHTLRSLLSVGVSRLDETYTLEEHMGGCRLSVGMIVSVPLPVLGGIIARRSVGPRTRAAVTASLEAIKSHCEGEDSSRGPHGHGP